MSSSLYPLRFRPLYKQYIWGGRRLGSVLGKPIGPGPHYAESWEVCDHDDDQSVVEAGPLAGATLGSLVARHAEALLGRHHPRTRFPLLVKFLDAAETLSVQVHPNDAQAAGLDPPDLGKHEAWVVLAAEPGSLIYAGLAPGVDRKTLEAAIREGTCREQLHCFEPAPGDCVFLPAGTVHALGAGLLVAEIQQASDTTYRLFDWNRLGSDGKPRALHVREGLQVIDFNQGQLGPQVPQPTCRPGVDRLVACEKFLVDRWHVDEAQVAGGDERCHVLCVLEGSVEVAGDRAGRPLSRGQTILLPAVLGEIRLTPQGPTVLLDAYLP